jgi:2,4-dienoyl-CoA reductase-like NADH-dependent reductase (Old Yellow Enzyme family)
MGDTIFTPLVFRNLTVKNRIVRSNISGRFDNFDGSGNQARINWELKFAQGGVGAIPSSFVPVTMRGRIVPNYATIDHKFDCKFILQLSHGGRQRDLPGFEYPKGLSSRSLVANNDLVKQFAAGADRPAVPCTYCNKCLVNAVKNPLGCYEESRFASRDEMIAQIYSVFQPPEFQAAGGGA